MISAQSVESLQSTFVCAIGLDLHPSRAQTVYMHGHAYDARPITVSYIVCMIYADGNILSIYSLHGVYSMVYCVIVRKVSALPIEQI